MDVALFDIDMSLLKKEEWISWTSIVHKWKTEWLGGEDGGGGKGRG